jgi:hypothetical protein
MEMALAADLQRSALAQVVVSSCGKYTVQFNMFITCCEALSKPRASLPASGATVAFYMQSVMNGTKTFICAGEGRVRRDRLLLEDQPLRSRAHAVAGGLPGAQRGDAEVRTKREESERTFRGGPSCGLRGSLREPTPGYCHLVVATMAVIIFGGMCRYDDASSLL